MAINYGIYCLLFNRPALESVLKKFANIRKIIMHILSNGSNIKKLVAYKYSSIRSALNSSIFKEELFAELIVNRQNRYLRLTI